MQSRLKPAVLIYMSSLTVFVENLHHLQYLCWQVWCMRCLATQFGNHRLYPTHFCLIHHLNLELHSNILTVTLQPLSTSLHVTKYNSHVDSGLPSRELGGWVALVSREPHFLRHHPPTNKTHFWSLGFAHHETIL